MGTLHYGSPPASFTIDDRALAHVELVIMAKLRRRENLSFAIVDEATSVRQAMWISPVTRSPRFRSVARVSTKPRV